MTIHSATADCRRVPIQVPREVGTTVLSSTKPGAAGREKHVKRRRDVTRLWPKHRRLAKA
jgi:hypothetical protein